MLNVCSVVFHPLHIAVHISLNIASDSSVSVEMSNVVNSALHVSINNGARCSVDVKIDKAYNSSIHLRKVDKQGEAKMLKRG